MREWLRHLVGVLATAALVLGGLFATGWVTFLAYLILGPMPTP